MGRTARAAGVIELDTTTLDLIRQNQLKKGDVLAVAQIAGIQAAKRTAELIPLCHPLSLDSVTVEFTFLESAIEVSATASLTGRTGVEMEAMTATSVALLTVYDMSKALEKGMVIGDIRLIAKTGGKSGDWHRNG